MNILQSLADQAKKRKDQLVHDIAQAPAAVGNVLSHIGAAPHPVQTNPVQVQQALAHPQFVQRGLQQPVQRQQFNQSLQQPRQGVMQGIQNLAKAQFDANNKVLIQPFVGKPAAEVVATVRDKLNGGTYGGSVTAPKILRPFVGDGPTQSIQQKTLDQYKRQSTSSNPFLRIASKPLAAAEAGLSIANDIPVVGAGLKVGTRALEAGVPKAIPAAKGAIKALDAERQAADLRMTSVKASNDEKRQIKQQIKGARKQINNLPIIPETARPANILAGRQDVLQSKLAQNRQQHGTIQNPLQKVTDRVLTAQPGFSMKAVHSSDLHPDQNQFIEDYAKILKQNDAGNESVISAIKQKGGISSSAYNDVPLTVKNSKGMSADRVAQELGYSSEDDLMAAVHGSKAKQNNADYFDKARAEIESGKAPYGLSDHYKELTASLQDKPLDIPAGFEDPKSPAPATTPTQQRPGAAKPAPKTPASKGTQSVDGNSLPQDTAPINVSKYLKQQTAAQEAARQAGSPTGMSKLKAGTANQKRLFVDSLAPIEDKLNTRITAENATGHITPQLDRALRADSIAGQYIKDEGLAKVIQSVPKTREFDQYLIAKHAPAYEAEHGAGASGRNLAADRQLVDSLAPKYEQHAQAINQYSQKLLDKAVDYGLVSKEAATALKARYPDYVPLNRVFGEGELPTPPKGTGGGKASIGSQTAVVKGKGSQRQIESPLDSLVHKTKDVIDQGERNRAAQILTGYKDLPGNPFGLRELAKDETVGTKPVISVLENGAKRQFETTPEIANAAKSLSKEQLGLIGKILAVPTRVLRLGATGLNPAFAGANVIKDLASGAINSKNPLRSSVANPTVFLDSLKAALNHGSKQYGELVREGAGGTSFDIARDAPKQNIASIRAQKNAGTRVAYTVTHPAQLFRAAENAIGRSEEFSRAMQYYGGKQGALAKGASPDAAKVLGAHAARNNTVNFARAGDYGRVLNSVLPYLNAGIQGSRTLIRTAGERPVQTAAKIAILGFLPTATTTAWNVATPDRKAAYDDIKPYEKQGNLIIVPPNPKKDPVTNKWNVIKIPVSQEIANLNNIVRNGIETGLKDGSFSPSGLVGDLVGTATSLNAQSPRQLLGQVTPQAVKPALETVFNQNLFTGNKIVPDSQKHLDPRDQYGPNSTGTSRTIGKGLNLSPRLLDNAISTATGGLGQNIVNLTDKGLAKTGVISPDEVRGKSFGTAIKGRFAGATGSSPYDAIDTKTADLTKQLKNEPGYKAMDPADKSKALSRLTNQITQTYTSKKALTPKQQAIDNGSINVKDYLTASTSGNQTPISNKIDRTSQQVLKDYNSLNEEQRKSKAYKENDYDYKVAQAKYDNAVANGSLSKAQTISQRDALTRDKVGSSFSKDTRDLYGLSKNEVYDLITQDSNGKQIASDLLAYGDALQKATGTQNKFRTKKGAESFQTAARGGSTGGGRTKSLSALLAEFKTPYSDQIKNASKGASLARSAHLAKKA